MKIIIIAIALLVSSSCFAQKSWNDAFANGNEESEYVIYRVKKNELYNVPKDEYWLIDRGQIPLSDSSWINIQMSQENCALHSYVGVYSEGFDVSIGQKQGDSKKICETFMHPRMNFFFQSNTFTLPSKAFILFTFDSHVWRVKK